MMLLAKACKVGLLGLVLSWTVVGLMEVVSPQSAGGVGTVSAWDINWDQPTCQNWSQYGTIPQGFLYPIRDYWIKNFQSKGWEPGLPPNYRLQLRYKSGYCINSFIDANTTFVMAEVHFYKMEGGQLVPVGSIQREFRRNITTGQIVRNLLKVNQIVNGRYVSNLFQL